jgi:hypothetical protein
MKLIPFLVVAFAVASAGCDRKAPDNMNPKTSVDSSRANAPQTAPGPNDARPSAPK